MIPTVKVIEMNEPPSLRELARLLDSVLNPAQGDRTEGFILLRFGHGQPGRPSYVASCDDSHTIRLLKMMLAHLEGRIQGEEGNA